MKIKYDLLTLGAIAIFLNVIGTFLVTFISMLFPDWGADAPIFPNAEVDIIFVMAVFIAVVIVSPIWEELFFRGLLWWGFSKVFKNSLVTIVTTSLIFASAHGAPRMIGIIPIAFFLGHVREKTDSIKLCIYTHMIFNLFAFIVICFSAGIL